ncbi:transmembrane protein, putative (macronuclear) [Tetrahymena thermophila SB210]|uniref:Transmembrane protein, putative n=1 Tax=Tetrahymena thermophila (strain SB210) TaxID=312017 RepID=A4VDN3_TETTS|nr:transmembrane protein, putative [Tetrahymena thermophila SB210]EDK31640.2 transmembrane protein, putative [Tetrahymena thermophila SB210]|eukprot:XP_001470842.2 transmembrane protein, putative [Tetrahymena thermophila SB210]
MSSIVFGLSNQQVLSNLKILEQITHVKQGFFIQSENQFSSPLQYSLENQTIDRQSIYKLVGINYFISINVLIDQVYQRIDIQYPLISQIFSFVISIFNLLMLIGFIAKKASLNAIKKDFFMLFLQNHYLDIYLQISKDVKLVKQNYQSPQTELSKQKQLQNDTEEECDNLQIQDEIDSYSFKFNTRIPSISVKMKQMLDSRVSMIKQKDLEQ